MPYVDVHLYTSKCVIACVSSINIYVWRLTLVSTCKDMCIMSFICIRSCLCAGAHTSHIRICIYSYIYTPAHIAHACTYACMNLSKSFLLSMYIRYVYMYIYIYLPVCVCISVCLYVCLHACMYVCVYARVYICTHVCVCIYRYM